MASIKTQFSVGLFVLVGLAVVAVSVIWLGMSHYLEKGKFYVAYFDESVQGLDRDSAVKYRGVPIGRVESLGAAPDGTLIQAVVKIETDVTPGEDWVAQLKSVGITGLMFIELDRKAPGEPDQSPKISFPSKYPIIPTKPSGIKQFVEGIADVLDQMKALDVAGISDRLKKTIDRIDRTLEEAHVGEVSGELRASLEGIRKLVTSRKVDRILDELETAGSSVNALAKRTDGAVGHLDTTLSEMNLRIQSLESDFRLALSDFRGAVKSADDFFVEGNGLVKDGKYRMANLERQLVYTLRELRDTTDRFNRLVETVSEQPSRLIFSEPMPQRALEPDQ